MAKKRRNGPLGFDDGSFDLVNEDQGTLTREDANTPRVELSFHSSKPSLNHQYHCAHDEENKFLVFENDLPQLSSKEPLYAAISKTARKLNMWIVARQTNPESLKYIANPNYCSKSISCKPKTASLGAIVFENGTQITSQSSGLVADPTRIPGAFHPSKLDKALQIWKEFAKKHLDKLSDQGYEVDRRPNSRHYGCLMKDRKWIHGDLDLFDVIMISRETGKAKDQKVNRPIDHEKENISRKAAVAMDIRLGTRIEGEENYYMDPTRVVGEKINMLLGKRMVHHGAQISFGGFDSEALDVFAPDGRMFELPTRTHARGWYFRRWPDRDTKKEDGFKF